MIDIFKNNEQNLTKIQVGVTLLLVLFFSIVGSTYAYFAISLSNSVTINGESATVNLTLDVRKVFPSETSDNTGVLVPQKSISGSASSPLANALKSGCVDGNKNVVCQVYKIDIGNVGGTATQVIDGMISFYSDSLMKNNVHTKMPNLKWKLITSVDETTPTNSVLGTNEDLEANSNNNVFADDVVMATDFSTTYYLIIWINETNTDQTDKSKPGSLNQFYGKITFNSSNGTGVTSAFTA